MALADLRKLGILFSLLFPGQEVVSKCGPRISSRSSLVILQWVGNALANRSLAMRSVIRAYTRSVALLQYYKSCLAMNNNVTRSWPSITASVTGCREDQGRKVSSPRTVRPSIGLARRSAASANHIFRRKQPQPCRCPVDTE